MRPCAARPLASSAETSLPSTRTVPPSVFPHPPIAASRAVFPAPFGPSRPTTSPAHTRTETPFTMLRPFRVTSMRSASRSSRCGGSSGGVAVAKASFIFPVSGNIRLHAIHYTSGQMRGPHVVCDHACPARSPAAAAPNPLPRTPLPTLGARDLAPRFPDRVARRSQTRNASSPAPRSHKRSGLRLRRLRPHPRCTSVRGQATATVPVNLRSSRIPFGWLFTPLIFCDVLPPIRKLD